MQADIIEGFRLSPQQRRLWGLGSRETPLLSSFGLRLRGPLEAGVMERAVRRVVEKHESLRTTFHDPEGLEFPLQVVQEGPAPAVFSAGEAADLDVEYERVLRDEPSPGLQSGPPLRCHLASAGPDDHLLVVRVPAMCADLASLLNLARELAEAYTATRAGGDFPEAEIQYLQYSEWRNEQEDPAGEGIDAPPLRLPFETAPEGAAAFAPRSVSFAVPVALGADASSLAGRHGAEPATFWLACWQALLWKLTGEDTLSTGYLFHGRTFEELAEAVGPFAQVVPLRVRVAGDDHFGELLEGVEAALGEAVGGEEVRAATAEETAGGLAVQFESARSAPLRMDGVDARLHRPRAAADRFRLKLSYVSQGAFAEVTLFYDPAFYPDAAAERLLRSLRTLAEDAVGNPGGRIDGLALLDESDRRELLVEFNDTAAPLGPRLAHELLDARCRETEGAAVLEGGEALSFQQLAADSDRLAVYLQAQGIGADDRVGVCLPRSARLVVALLGVLKSGAAYVPLDPGDPPQRLRHVLADAEPRVILGDEASLAALGAQGATLALDTRWDEIAALAGDRRPRGGVREGDLAYLIYTSGSTGLPKGACITHRGLLNYLEWAGRHYRVGEGSGSILHSPVTFDLAVTSLFAPLLAGRPVHVLPQGADVQGLAELLEAAAEPLSFLKLTPAHLALLAGQLAPAAAGKARVLIVGGEALHAEQVAFWRREAPEVRIVNEYGPTETVVGCCVYEVADGPGASGPVPIGRPVANTRLYVLDARMEPVPAGAAGELYVGGAGVARGYHRRPALTAERFVPDPFSGEPGARLYRTGDAVRLGAAGGLEFLGRRDEQVKIRGYRVELGEIEGVLRAHPGVAEAAALLRTDGADPRLVAYVSWRQGEVPEAALRSYLRERLPEYMIPARVVALDALPLARSGKVDRKALPAPDESGEPSGPGYVAPGTLLQEVLCTLWSEVLNRDRVGIDDNFFALGGDSIRSIRLRSLARQRGVAISNQELFQHQTIRALAEHVRFGDDTATPAFAPTLPFELVPDEDRALLPGTVEDAFPLAALQAGMVFHSELAPESAVFHHVHAIDLRIPFREEALRRALGQLVQRHPVLRASFDLARYSRPLVLVHREVPLPLEVEDLRALSRAEQDELLARWMDEETHRPFDLSRAPLIRVTAHRRTDESCRFGFSFHHAVLDGWSVASLLTELFRGYLQFCEEGEPAALPDIPVAFRDFVALEQAAVASAESRSFWSGFLSDVTVRPIPRLAEEGARGAHMEEVPIPDEVSSGLKRLSRSISVPIKSILLAAHLRVLAHWTGERDVVTGLVTNGRPEAAGGDRVAGLFLNTVPFRMRLGAESGAELAQRVFEAERDIIPHRRYPLPLLQQENGGKLFDTAFNFMHFHVYESLQGLGGDVELEGWDGYAETDFPLTADFSLDLQTSKVNLQLNCHPGELGMELIREIARSYATVLAAIAADPAADLRALPLFSAGDAEGRRVLVEWNDTAREYPEGALHELIEAQAARTPDAVALRFEDESLTYAELDRRAEQLAARLAERGVGAESVVGLCAERSLEMVIALLGILKSGGAYLPLDPENPAERLQYMLSHSGARVVLAQKRFSNIFDESDCDRLDLEEACAEGGAERVRPRVLPENGAYVIYTSGTTGLPKGVMVPHRGIVNRLFWMQEAFGLGADDAVLQKTPYTFDVSVWEFFWPLMTGATLVIARPGGHRDPDYLTGVIEREGVTTLHFVPSMLDVFLQAPAAAGLGGVRRVMCSGEALAPESVQRFHETFQHAELHNLYGPTEASVDVSWWPAARGQDLRTVPIGKPIANTTLYVLGAAMEPLPAGVAGELYIGGVQLARGYASDPAQTAERFVPDPFGSGRLYRTGDRARWLPTGEIEYLGRADFQVKIRGYRIELGEIEHALTAHGAVRQAVVVAAERGGHAALVAYVVPAGEAPAVAELREALERRLPEYMVPAHIIIMEALPLTPNGKVDRKALPVPGDERPEMEGEYVAPRDEVERTLAAIFGEVLSVSRVGIHDNFFRMGGHSLPAIQVVSRIRHALRVELPLRFLFDFPTVEGLAARLAALGAGEGRMAGGMEILPRRQRQALVATGEVDLDDLLGEMEELDDREAARRLDAAPLAEEDVNPLTYDQERVWALEQANDGSFRYTVSFMFRLQGPLDEEALVRSIGEIVRRHEVLRSAFAVRDGRPVQIVSPTLTVPVDRTDLGALSEAEREAAMQESAGVEAGRPFDLAAGPLARAHLYALQPDEHVLLMVMHALVMDNWSVGILFRELGLLYQAYLRGEEGSLPPLRVQVADYARWEREWVGVEKLPSLLEYWRGQLPGRLTPMPLRGRDVVPSDRGDTRTLELGEELSRRVRDYAREEGMTPFMIALAGFKLLLSARSGREAVWLGAGVAMRNRVETEALLGSFMNILLLRTDFAGDPTFGEALGRVRDVTFGAFAHQEMPWVELLRMLREEGRVDDGVSPTRIMVDHITASAQPQEVAGLRVTPVAPDRQLVTGSDMGFRLREEGDALVATMFFKTDLFGGAEIEDMLHAFRELLHAGLENPSTPISVLLGRTTRA